MDTDHFRKRQLFKENMEEKKIKEQFLMVVTDIKIIDTEILDQKKNWRKYERERERENEIYIRQ